MQTSKNSTLKQNSDFSGTIWHFCLFKLLITWLDEVKEAKMMTVTLFIITINLSRSKAMSSDHLFYPNNSPKNIDIEFIINNAKRSRKKGLRSQKLNIKRVVEIFCLINGLQNDKTDINVFDDWLLQLILTVFYATAFESCGSEVYLLNCLRFGWWSFIWFNCDF